MSLFFVHDIERNGLGKKKSLLKNANSIWKVNLFIFCMYFFIAVLNCVLVCFVLPRPGGREEGLAQRTSCLPAVFHYFMFLSIFPPQFCVLLQFPPFQLQPPLSLFLLPSRLLFSFCFSSVLTCSSFPCRFLAFVISPAFFQQILQGSSQLLPHL